MHWVWKGGTMLAMECQYSQLLLDLSWELLPVEWAWYAQIAEHERLIWQWIAAQFELEYHPGSHCLDPSMSGPAPKQATQELDEQQNDACWGSAAEQRWCNYTYRGKIIVGASTSDIVKTPLTRQRMRHRQHKAEAAKLRQRQGRGSNAEAEASQLIIYLPTQINNKSTPHLLTGKS